MLRRNVGRVQGHCDGCAAGGDFHIVCQRSKLGFRGQLVPEFDFVASRRQVADLEASVVGRDGVVRSWHCDNSGAHFTVDIAEDVGHSGLRKAYLPDRSAFIESQVKGFPTIDGEDIVKKRVLVGELDLRACSYGDYVRSESFVFLDQSGHVHRSHSPLMLNGVAHDFNNLVMIIKGYCDMLLDSATVESRPHLEEIKRAGDRASALTRQLLAFSRKQILEPQVLDPNQTVGNMVKMLRVLIGEDIELVTSLSDQIGRVQADPGQLEQVVMNLAVNARDAMPDGGKLVIETQGCYLDDAYIAANSEASPGRNVLIAVTDNGCGMSKEALAQIFEPFSTANEQGKGTGLGLAAVYGIVKQSRGHISVHSEIGRGTTLVMADWRGHRRTTPRTGRRMVFQSIFC
jgi:Histidine kinase-, DNA gyrase B-, and HSP90-like ATPase/His Kinase A (phospho-acceptor) domain